jgi:hypothetical protein
MVTSNAMCRLKPGSSPHKQHFFKILMPLRTGAIHILLCAKNKFAMAIDKPCRQKQGHLPALKNLNLAGHNLFEI